MNAPVSEPTVSAIGPHSATLFTHADGVYFGLSDVAYHADPALGSTDIKRLAYDPEGWWHDSVLNPDREPEDDTPARIFGRAVHKVVLEGRDAFHARYGRCSFPGNVKAGKEERAAFEEAGKASLKADDFDRVLTAGAAIKGNPHLADAFSGGYPEVSVFWTADGIRRKCRMDYVKVRATTDLKSIRPQRPTSFDTNCRRALSDYRYDVQAAHYIAGRRAGIDLIQAGQFDGEPEPAWLDRLQADAAFVIVFYQAEGAPLTWGCAISPENPLLEIAKVTIRQAEENFRDFAATFGPAVPWLRPAPLDELDISQLPRWHGND